MSQPINLKLFGTPSLSVPRDQNSFPELGYQLVALLTMSPDFSMPRAQVMAMLWGGARPSLEMPRLLAQLRSACPHSFCVRADGNQLALTEFYQASDVTLFRTLSRSPETEDRARAAALYDTGFLEGLDAPQTETFSEWLYQARAGLRKQFVACSAEHQF